MSCYLELPEELMRYLLGQNLIVGREYSTVDDGENNLLEKIGWEQLIFWTWGLQED